MELNISNEVQELMEKMRVHKKEDKLKALEDKRLREEAMRIAQEMEDKKVRQLLIKAEATIRLEIENYDSEMIKCIKNKIRQYPNMHIIELCEMFMGKINKNDLADKFPLNKLPYKIIHHIPPYITDVDMDKYDVLIYNKKKEIYDAFILKCRMEN